MNPSFFTLRIPAGQTTATVTVTPLFTPEVEGPETVILSAEGSSATVTIADEPAVTLAATDPDAAELGLNTATVVVTRTGPTTYDRDVLISLSGTALNNNDYLITSPALIGLVNPSSFTVRIPAGQTTANVTITPIADGISEGAETIILSAEGAVATATIVDQFMSLTFTVTHDGRQRSRLAAAGDSGRQYANPADPITFAISGSGVTRSSPGQPSDHGTVIIDGTTQPGFTGTPIIELNGFGAPAGADGLYISAADSVIRGLIINRYSGDGIA